MLMMGVRKSWYRASLDDPAYFNVMLAHYAACVTVKTKLGDPVESLVFRMEASQIVNKRLKLGVDNITDGTIGAVASILVYEVGCISFLCLLLRLLMLTSQIMEMWML